MFSEHLQHEFKGNLQEMQPLRSLMITLPEKFELFGVPIDTEEINEELALDFEPDEDEEENDDEWAWSCSYSYRLTSRFLCLLILSSLSLTWH